LLELPQLVFSGQCENGGKKTLAAIRRRSNGSTLSYYFDMYRSN
jgi:hypothetical protein